MPHDPAPIYETTREQLSILVYRTARQMGLAAALEARRIVQAALYSAPECSIILATGDSQVAFLAALSGLTGIDWSRVNIFHMDEYVGLDEAHPAGFRSFLKRNVVDRVQPRAFYPVPGGAADLATACREYEALLRVHPAALCVLGIGDNGHLAFNDPPADFHDPVWVKVVTLDPITRLQQVREGHFPSVEAVPARAITLTIPALLSAGRLLCLAPGARKAETVRRTLGDPVSPAWPATILRQTAHARLYTDAAAAARSPTLRVPEA